MGQPSSEMTPFDKPVKDRLDSWKEIATYKSGYHNRPALGEARGDARLPPLAR